MLVPETTAIVGSDPADNSELASCRKAWAFGRWLSCSN
jgi:hypothetical protein